MRTLLAVALATGFVSVGGHRMYYACAGVGSPTIVLDAGSPDTTAAWSAVEPQLARVTRVCAYDRAGLGRSAPAHGYRTAQTQAHDLHALLHAARISGPYVVVGHSWGGLVVRLFAHDWPRETAGVVLVDPTTFPYGVPPMKVRSREGIDVHAAERESNAVTSLGSLPLVVLTSNRPPQQAKMLASQDALAALSTDSVHAVATRSTHYVQKPPPLGQPAVVVAAVTATVHAARAHAGLPTCASLFRGLGASCR